MAQDNATVNLYINNEQAKGAIAELRKSYQDLKREREAADKAGDVQKSLDLQAKEYSALQKLKETTHGVLDIEKAMSNLSVINIRQLTDVRRTLTRQLRELNQNTDEYIVKMGQLRKVEEQIAQTRGKSSSWVSKITPTISVDNIAQRAIAETKQAVDAYAQYDDKLADVMKTTGLGKEATEELSASLAAIDTRSSQQELLGLAQQAGKLGLSASEDVEKFTIAADKIGVALGEDLGDKEQAINSMGKLVDLFKVKDEYGMAEGMTRVGSAVNALGAASTANEGYIVNFTKQIGGMSQQAGISVQNILGIGATLDKFGQRTEASATVVANVIVGMHDKTAQYAKVAKMSIDDFSQLLSQDANEAMIKVFEGMAGGGMQKVVDLLGDLGEDGARAGQVLSALAGNTADLRAQQALANEEFEKGTSLHAEFETKNNTAAARREKQQKEAQAALVELGRALQPILDLFYAGSITAMKALKMLLGVIYEYKGVIAAVAVAVGGYVAIQKLEIFYSAANSLALQKEAYAMLAHTQATIAGTVATGKYTLASKALGVVKMVLAGQVRAAGVAFKSLWAAMGPIGWAVTAISVIVGVMKAFSNETDIATRNAQQLADIELQAAKSIIAEKMELESYLRVASDKERSDGVRHEAMLKLQQLMPNGIDLINQETIANGKAKVAVDKYCESLLLRAQFEAAKNMLVKQEEERLEKMQNGKAYELDWWQYTKSWLTGFVGFSGTSSAMVNEYMSKNSAKFKAETAANTDFLTKHIDDIKGKLNSTGGKDGGATICTKCGKSPCECYKNDPGKQQAWTLENDAKFAEKRVALKRKQLAGEYATEEGYAKELLALEITTLEARIATAKDKGAELAKIKEQLLDKQITQEQAAKKRSEALIQDAHSDDSESAKATREYTAKLKERELYGRKLEDMTAEEKAAFLTLERVYNTKLGEIGVKAMQKRMTEQQQELDKKITAICLAQGEELAAADTLEKKKLLLKKWFSDEELRRVTTTKEADRLLKARYASDEQAATKKELTDLLTTYKDMASEISSTGGLFGGVIKFTDEERAKLEEIINKLREDLSKLNQNPVATPKEKEKKKTDILGMSVEDWSTMFKNTEDGLTSMEKMEVAAKAIGQAFSAVSDLMAAMEQRDFKNYEKTQNKKKKSLDKQLKSGAISQEVYNSKVQAIDDQTEAKRVEMERKQAERQKAMAIFNAITSTAVGVVSAMTAQPFGPWNIALAALVGAMGAVQIATIIATPLPGAEKGGMLVEREQDGKQFNAEFDPNKRGAVDKPTVIVGENGSEYVIPAEGYANPTIRPMINMLEQARTSGRLRSIDLPAVMAAGMMSGRAQGGYVTPTATTTPTANTSPDATDPRMVDALASITAATNALCERLNQPIEATAKVSIAGRGGVAEGLNKYNELKSRSRIGGRNA